MGPDHGVLDDRRRDIDPESLIREIASLRTYLLFMGARFSESRPLREQGVSDLVNSVLGDVFVMVREGDDRFEYRSFEELKAWLVNRLRWAYRDAVKREERYDKILRDLPPPSPPRTPSSVVVGREQDQLLVEARAGLDPAQRRLIEWRVDEKLTFEEIARRLGRSISISRAHRAYRKAMNALDSNYRRLGGVRSCGPGGEDGGAERTTPPEPPSGAFPR